MNSSKITKNHLAGTVISFYVCVRLILKEKKGSGGGNRTRAACTTVRVPNRLAIFACMRW